jgi:hypothetical protein
VSAYHTKASETQRMRGRSVCKQSASSSQRSADNEDTQRKAEPENGRLERALASLPDSANGRSLMADGILDRLAADIVPGASVRFQRRGPCGRRSLS